MKTTDYIAGTQYLPPIEYFVHWLHHGAIRLEYHEHYQKRTWRNKTAILGLPDPRQLTVPLRKGKNHEMPINLVEISYDEPWNKQHVSSIQSAYGKTAFFDEIENDLEHIYNSKPQYLWDLNLQLIEFFISLLPGEWKIKYTNSYEASFPGTTLDLRRGVIPNQISGVNITAPFYQQVHRFTESHLPNLSILDLLCHCGPGTVIILKEYEALLYS